MNFSEKSVHKQNINMNYITNKVSYEYENLVHFELEFLVLKKFDFEIKKIIVLVKLILPAFHNITLFVILYKLKKFEINVFLE